MTLSVQFLTMITMTSGGFYLGMAVDTFRRFKIHWKDNPLLVYILEISFWLSQTFILYYLLFLANSGELRIYVFLACLLGFSAYQALAAPLYKRGLERIIVIVKNVYQFFEKVFIILIIRPIQYLIQLITILVISMLGFIWKVVTFCIHLLFAPVQWLAKKVYALLPKKIQLFFHRLAGFYSKIENIVIKCVKYISSKRR